MLPKINHLDFKSDNKLRVWIPVIVKRAQGFKNVNCPQAKKYKIWLFPLHSLIKISEVPNVSCQIQGKVMFILP